MSFHLLSGFLPPGLAKRVNEKVAFLSVYNILHDFTEFRMDKAFSCKCYFCSHHIPQGNRRDLYGCPCEECHREYMADLIEKWAPLGEYGRRDETYKLLKELL